MGEVLFLCMWSKEFYLLSFVVLKMFSLHEIRILTLDTLFTFFQLGIIDYFSQRPYFACLFSSISSGASVFLCIPAVYRVFMFLCIFLFYFLRCIHTVTLHGVASSQVSMFFLWRGRENHLSQEFPSSDQGTCVLKSCTQMEGNLFACSAARALI